MRNIFNLVSLFALVSLASNAFAISLSLPKNPEVVKRPAFDLIDGEGQPISSGDSATLSRQKIDTSVYNPKDNKMWQNKAYLGTDEATRNYPKNGGVVRFVKDEAYNRFTYLARVQDPKNPTNYFRLGLSRFTHSMLMRAALLRKLGYMIPSPKFYNNITVQFDSLEEMTEFQNRAQAESINDFEERKWITNKDEKSFSLTFSNASLEPAMAEYFDIHWAFVPNPGNPAHVSMIQNLGQYRAFRALIVPFVLVDIPESINRYSAKVAFIRSGDVVFTHESAATFEACSYEDARWLVRRIAAFTQKDWEEVVALGQFPKDIDKLVLAKLLHRTNNLLELFDLKPTTPLDLLDLNFTSKSGLVSEGKVTQEYVDGYPQRFAHGDRESPFTEADIGRYISIEAVTSGINYALTKANESLVLQGVADLGVKRQKEVYNKIIDHIKNRPMQPLEQKIGSWGGPVGRFNVGASRHVTTGTYYDSHAPIQLVDSLHVGGSVGYFHSFDGMYTLGDNFRGVFPALGGNLTYNRSYTHVRPIESVKQASDYDWGKLYIPGFMKTLGGVVGADNIEMGKCEEQLQKIADQKNIQVSELPLEDIEKCKQPLDRFMADLKNGEVFTITDSLAMGAYASLSSPLDILMGLNPFGFMNSISFGIDTGKAFVLKQTTIVRTDIGLQIITRTSDTTSFGAQFDLNYYLNLVRIRSQRSTTDIKSVAYLIEYNPEIAKFIDIGDKKGQELAEKAGHLKDALAGLFKENDPELFNAYFKDRRFEVDHHLKTKESRIKILTEKFINLDEGHLLKIRYPMNPKFPELKPEDEEVTIYAHKKGRLIGRDFIDFFTDLIDGIFKKSGLIAIEGSPNPANTPFGKAQWKIITSESDLTKNGETYPNVSLVQNVWGGWKLKRKDFLSLLEEITAKFKNVNLGTHRIIEPEAFANVSSVDFYRITANLSIAEEGMNRIRDLILQPDARERDKNANRQTPINNPLDALSSLFAGLSESFGSINDPYGGKYLPSDKEFVEDMIKLLGKGNYAQGRVKYTHDCKESQKIGGENYGSDPYTGAWWYGTSYACLAPWMIELIKLKRRYPTEDKQLQTEWITRALWALEENIPLPYILEYIGTANYIFFIRVNGFRTGDEDGDLEFFSNTSGDPAKKFENANGIINLYSTKTGIIPLELNRTSGSIQ